jgi:hypothetical protein
MLPSARLIPMDELRGELAVGCVDGRRHGCVIGAPGGNAGLLVVLLAALERIREKAFSEEELASLFRAYLDHFGAFYFHSDEPAMSVLRDTALDGPATREDIGCGHLRILFAEWPELVRGVLREAFRALRRGDERIHFEILSGDHREEGVLRIQAASAELMATCPHHGLHAFFVLHPDAVAWLEELHADFAAAAGWIPVRDVPRLVDAQRAVAARGLEQTLAALGAGLPVFDVEVRPGLGVTVSAAGFVPEPGQRASSETNTASNSRSGIAPPSPADAPEPVASRASSSSYAMRSLR